MKSSYKRIGEFIQLVDERNRELNINTLLGLSISKEFIPSVANTVGTNMANYKIIRKGQFACSLMQVRRDKKLPVALLSEYDEAIISQAYPVFEIKNTEELLPEYLMMWMSRTEFDRHACFLAVGGVRGSLEWDDFCDMPLPVPHIDKQREIVREYNVIVDRIKLNEQLNQKLEETAQAIYKQWFVDFEFPISKEYAAEIGKPELVGKPYKCSGGEMGYCSEIRQKIPSAWESKSFTLAISLGGGGTPSTTEPDYWGEDIPFFTGRDVTKNYFSMATEKTITKEGLNNSSSKLYKKNTTFVVARGATTGVVALAGKDMAMNQSCYAVVSDAKTKLFTHQLTLHLMKELKEKALGGAIFKALVTKDFDEQFVLSPTYKLKTQYNKIADSLYKFSEELLTQNIKLWVLVDLLLAKIAVLD